MGAYLSKPKTEVCSSSESNGRMSYGASAMQGWRVSMEDAHTCLLDFDDNTSLFAVYDGHGGQEVAEYVSKHLPETLKNENGYKEGNAKQALIDTFLKVDEDIVSEEGLKELKEIAGDNEESGDENEAEMLANDANIPLSELLAKLKEGSYKTEEGEEEEEEEESLDEEEEEEGLMNGDANAHDENDEAKKENGLTKESGTEKKENETEGSTEEEKDEEGTNGGEEDKEGDADEQGSDKGEVDDEGDADEQGKDKAERDEEGDEECDEDEEESDDDDEEDGGVFVKSDEAGYDSGTTAIVALVKDNCLTVANVGDSRCVLCRNGIALEMSIDHKPEDEKELSRIKKAGGKVTCEGRVNGGLNLSRALGDHSYKGSTELGAHEQQITAMPDIRQTQLTESDEFMVIACDGIWNVKNSQEVVDFVRKEKQEQSKNGDVNLSSICEKLFDACIAQDTSGDGSGCDNMTCIIVTFKAGAMTSSSTSSGKRKVAESESSERAEKIVRTE